MPRISPAPCLEVDAAQPLAVDPARLRSPAGRPGRPRVAPEVGVDVVADHRAGEGPRVERARRHRCPRGDRRAGRSPGRRAGRSRPSGARRRARSCRAGAPRPTTSKRRSTSSWGRTAVGSSSTSTPPPSQPWSARGDRHHGALHGCRGGQRPVDVEVDVERRERPVGSRPPAGATGPARRSRERTRRGGRGCPGRSARGSGRGPGGRSAGRPGTDLPTSKGTPSSSAWAPGSAVW